MKKGVGDAVRQYLKAIARKGGKARAAKYSKATLSKWGKKGGRPPKRKDGGKR
jgi:general stress protein YciG